MVGAKTGAAAARDIKGVWLVRTVPVEDTKAADPTLVPFEDKKAADPATSTAIAEIARIPGRSKCLATVGLRPFASEAAEQTLPLCRVICTSIAATPCGGLGQWRTDVM